MQPLGLCCAVEREHRKSGHLPQKKRLKAEIAALVLAILAVGSGLAFYTLRGKRDLRSAVIEAYRPGRKYEGIEILYPLDETLFPPEIVPPTFRWKDSVSRCDAWLIILEFSDGGEPMYFLSLEREWTPEAKDWEIIKKRTLQKRAAVTIVGVNRASAGRILSGGRISFATSKDEVGAPLFYREVNLPFIEAVKDPSRIRWRFGPISSPKPPPVVLEGLPVCGNCHSFSRDGKILAMDVDYANKKGSYIITEVKKDIYLRPDDIITWSDYKREDRIPTFGLLSQISPDGRYVVSTVKDRSVFVPRPDLAFSQLFFPIRGILVIYDRKTKTFKPLRGADDPRYVQSNPTWSPDGRYIVFARSKAYYLRNPSGRGTVLLSREECEEFLKEAKRVLFDLYRIPFNNGEGGTPEPLKGASHNGMSNFFPRYSPDGKWIVFCKAKSYMLLQPDSELYIIPAEGGEARRLRCNTRRMNSWHSWSPNGRWLVFSSKADSAFTRLYLTHIDENGRSSPPVSLAHMTAPDRAANIPEFVNCAPDAIKKMHEEFLNDYSFVRAGNEFFRAGDADNAIPQYKKALELNPNNFEAHLKLGFLFFHVKRMFEEGIAHTREALRLQPQSGRAHYDLAMALACMGKHKEAIGHFHEALRLLPEGYGKQYRLDRMLESYAKTLFATGRTEQAIAVLRKALRKAPRRAALHYRIATYLACVGEINEVLKHYKKALKLDPSRDTSWVLHELLALNYLKAERPKEALLHMRVALKRAIAAKDQAAVERISRRVRLLESMRSGRPPALPGGPIPGGQIGPAAHK